MKFTERYKFPTREVTRLKFTASEIAACKLLSSKGVPVYRAVSTSGSPPLEALVGGIAFVSEVVVSYNKEDTKFSVWFDGELIFR